MFTQKPASEQNASQFVNEPLIFSTAVENYFGCAIMQLSLKAKAMTMKKLLFVMNPNAGQRKANRLLAEIIGIFNRADYEVTVYMTDCTSAAERYVERYAPQTDLVVCCGGDGTFNETVSGLLKSGADIPVGYIAAGSTNDFANSLGLSTDILKAARNIVEGTASPIDMGSFNGRYFSYVASFGAFTKASYATPQSLKNALGHTAYILSGIQELSQIKTHRLRFTLPDGSQIEDDFLFGAVSNSTSMAGILTLAPDRVDMQDGLFELLLVRAPRDLMELSDCIIALQKQTYQCAMMTFLSTPSVTVYVPGELDWTLDGEHQLGCTDIQISNLRHAVRIIRREGRK